MSRRYRFAGTFMQSFSSMGPMLNFAGLYPLIIGASGYYAPFVALLATVASLLTVYAPYVLSKRYVTNGGYYSYSGIAFGGRSGKFVAMLYYAYGLLVIPDIACFIAVMVEGLTANRLIAYIAPLAFSIFVILLVYGSNRTAVLLITFLGMAEAVFIFVLDTSMFSSPPAGHALMASSFAGTIFALLAFSGSGSSIFVSEDSEKPGKYVPYSIVSTVLLGGAMMAYSFLADFRFLGRSLPAYTQDPFYLFSYLNGTPLHLLAFPFIIFSFTSATMLTVAYGNAMRRAVDSMRTDGVLKQGEWRLAFPVVPLAVSVLAEYALTSRFGFYGTFEVLATVVAVCFAEVHIFSNAALVKLSRRRALDAAVALASTSVLLYIIFENFAGPGLPTAVSIAVFALVNLTALMFTGTARRCEFHTLRVADQAQKDSGA